MKKTVIFTMLMAATGAFASSTTPAAKLEKTTKPAVEKAAPAISDDRLPPEPPKMNPALLEKLRKGPDREEQKAIIERQKEITSTLTPLTPEQINEIQRRAAEDERQINSSTTIKRITESRDVYWSVGSPTPELRMSPGYGATVLFFNQAGQPLTIAEAGAVVGNDDAYEANVTGNVALMRVKKPWQPSNMQVFLNGTMVPVPLKITSDRNGKDPIDEQLRVHIIDSTSGTSMDRPDTQNVNALLQLTNGAPGLANKFNLLPVASVEKGSPNNLNWTQISANVAQFRIGTDGMTYVLLKPGFRLLYPNVPTVLSSLAGADGTQGYIVQGNTNRIFTLEDRNGALYRVTVQR